MKLRRMAAALTAAFWSADPGPWAKGIAWPAWQYLRPHPCNQTLSPNRTCGIEGQVIDMIQNGESHTYLTYFLMC